MTTVCASLLACVLCALYAFFRLCLGRKVFTSCSSPSGRDDLLAEISLATAFGMGLLATVWSGLSILPRGLQIWTVLPVLLLPLPFAAREILAAAKHLNPLRWLPQERGLRCLALILLGLLALAVPMMWGTLTIDAIAFYFAQSKLMAYVHGFAPLPGYENFSLIPLPAELSASALMLLGGDAAGRMPNLLELWVSAGLIFSLAAACGLGERGRWISVLLLLASSSVNLLIASGKTDLYGAMLGLATLYVFCSGPDFSPRRAALAGLLTGFAITGKLSFLPVLVPMLAGLFVWRLWREPQGGRLLPQFLTGGIIISAGIFVSLALVMIRNDVFYHEPFAPFFFFDNSRDIGMTTQNWYSPEATRWILATYPLVWTLGQYPMQFGDLSPLVWGALPALRFTRRASFEWRGNIALVLALAGLSGMAVWIALYPSAIAPRYVFPALFAFIPLTALGLERFWESLETEKYKAGLFAALLIASSLVQVLSFLPEARGGLGHFLHEPRKGHILEVTKRATGGRKQTSAIRPHAPDRLGKIAAAGADIKLPDQPGRNQHQGYCCGKDSEHDLLAGYLPRRRAGGGSQPARP